MVDCDTIVMKGCREYSMWAGKQAQLQKPTPFDPASHAMKAKQPLAPSFRQPKIKMASAITSAPQAPKVNGFGSFLTRNNGQAQNAVAKVEPQ